MVGDHFNDKWKDKFWYPAPTYPTFVPFYDPPRTPDISREEFESLRKEVQEMIALMKRAKKYDDENDEPNCEMEEKMRALRQIAKWFGVDLDKELANK